MLNYVERHAPKTLSNDQLRNRIGMIAGLAAVAAGVVGFCAMLLL